MAKATIERETHFRKKRFKNRSLFRIFQFSEKKRKIQKWEKWCF